MLNSIKIENFRSCQDVMLELGDPVIALLGRNGVGKTNLLHAIQLAADLCVGEAESTLTLQPRDLSQPTTFVLRFSIDSDTFEYRIRQMTSPLNTDDVEESLLRGADIVFRRIGEDIEAPMSGLPQGVRLGAGAATLPALLQVLAKDDPLINVLKQVAQFLRTISYYPLLQVFQEHLAQPQPAWVGDGWNNPSPYIDKSTYDVWKVGFEHGHARRSVQMRLLHLYLTDQETFEELKTLLGNDGLGLLAEIGVEKIKTPGSVPVSLPSQTQDDSNDTAYSLTFVPGAGLAGAGRPFRYSGLSAGTWRILQLITYLLFDKSACMLLEQPEDSIHPGLLAKVIDILRTYSESTQLICTTHSPRVMNLVGPEGIRIVSAVEGCTSVSRLSAEYIHAANGYLQDEGTLAEFLETL